jgi:hypothetical protein
MLSRILVLNNLNVEQVQLLLIIINDEIPLGILQKNNIQLGPFLNAHNGKRDVDAIHNILVMNRPKCLLVL